jgi:adenine/guanine phosphoribosyltransferase-like PRPP-binding protein
MPTPAREPLQVDPALAHAAGGYLRNVIRRPGITCRVCAGPVGGYDRCWRCEQVRRIGGVADVVAPLSYAIAGTPSGALVRDYKNHPVRSVREYHSAFIKEIVWQAITRHECCIGRAVGLPVSRRLVIPSLTSRPGRHPFAELTQAMTATGDTAALLPAPDAQCDRAINDKFVLAPAARLDGQHVMILDDVWTTGSNAQSASLAVRRAGAAAISVMVVGRWLSPDRQRTADFIATRLHRDYDPDICPVTGAECP